jgi:urease accessory protein
VNEVTLRAHPEAVVMVWDAIVPHDPSGGDGTFDWIASDLHVQSPDGSTLARDRYRLEGRVLSRRMPGVTGPFKYQGTFVVVQRQIPQRTLLDSLRAAIPVGEGLYAGASSLPGACGAWVRVLAGDTALLRDALERAWYSARKLITGAEPRPRRK